MKYLLKPFALFIVIQLLTHYKADAQNNIYIVENGGDIEGEGWILEDGLIETTADVSINASTLLNKLQEGPTEISASYIGIEASIISTSANRLTLKASENIDISSNITIQTNGGDIVFWTNPTASNSISGHIRLNSGVVLNTTNGSTDPGLSGGGHIILAGGGDSDGDGYPDGFAKTNSTYGIRLDTGVELYSAGGDIIVRGETYSTSTNRSGIYQTGDLTIDSGVGSIFIEGKNRSGYGSWPLQLGNGTVGTLSLTSDKGSDNAITLKSTAGRNGIYLGGTANADMAFKATGGGDIVLTTKHQIQTTSDYSFETAGGAIVLWSDNQQARDGNIKIGSNNAFTSQGGDIILAGGNADDAGYPKNYASTTSTYGIQLDSGVEFDSSGGDVILKGETYSTSTNRSGIYQTGDLTIDSGVGSIFIEGKNRSGYGSWALQLGNSTVDTLSLVSAKPSGDAITLKTTGGRYGVYLGGTTGKTMEVNATGGGNIRLDTPHHIQTESDYVFKTTGSGTITFKSEDYIRLGQRNQLQTDNADIVLWTNQSAANNVSGGIRLDDGTTLNTNDGSETTGLSGGGHIILAGGSADNDGYPDGFAKTNSTYGILLDPGVKLHSGGGDVILKGETYSTSTNRHGIYQTGDLTIDSGTGSIFMEGKNRSGYGSWPLYLGSGTVGTLSLISAKPSGDAITIQSSTGRYGTYLGGTVGGTMEVKATGGGDIVVTAKREVVTTDDYTFQTNGGDIVMWPNNTALKKGRLSIGKNNTFNSAGGATDQATGGGDVIFAGGIDDGNNRPDGYARDDGNRYGIDLRTGLTIHSGGGDITLKGRTNKYNDSYTRGIRQRGDLTMYSGKGAILFDGQILRTRGAAGYGIEFADGTSNTISVVSDKAPGDAITINGNNTTNTWGIYFGATASGRFEATGGGHIVATTARGLYVHSNYTFQTDGGDIVMWPNNTALKKGRLYIGNNSTFNSAGGATNQGTGGGDVIFAGGIDDGNNRPDGYARDDGNRYGIDIRTGLKIHSGGGDITLKGRTNKYNDSYTRGIRQRGDLTMYSGEGAILFDGQILRTRGAAGYGIEFADGTSNTISVVSDKAPGDAITINGNNTTNTYGIYFGATTNGRFEATSGGNLVVTTARGILTRSGYTFQTDGGNVVFWADTDGNGDGRIYTQNPIVFNSAGGSTNQSSGGGTIVLAGGSDNGANGQTADDGIPDGFAYDRTWRGVYLSNGAQMYSGGGDVIIRGRTYHTGNTYAIQQNNDLTIHSGQGQITLHGKTRTDRDGDGVLLANGGTTNGFSLVSDKATGTAVEIIGEAHSYGVISNSGGSTKTIEATGGGDVIIDGKTPKAGYGVYLRDFDVLAADGAVTIDGHTTGIWLYDMTLGQLNNTLVASSDADVTLRADEFRTSGSSTVETTGEVTIEPYSESFTDAFTYPITNVSVSTDATELTVGKLSNNVDITVAASTTINGDISFFGRDITLNNNTTVKSTGAQSDIAMVASRNFINSAGSKAIESVSGRWTVYLDDRLGNTYGDLNSENIPFQGSTYSTLPPNEVAGGTRYVFAESFSTDFTINAKNVTKEYGFVACLNGSCLDENKCNTTVLNPDPSSSNYLQSGNWGGLNSPQLSSGTSWSGSSGSSTSQFVGVTFSASKIQGVITKGRGDVDQWVTSYDLQATKDGTTWTSLGIFSANSDRNTEVFNEVSNTDTDWIGLRINPRTWRSHPSLRFQVKLADSCQVDSNYSFEAGYEIISDIKEEPNVYLGGSAGISIPLSSIYSEIPDITSTKAPQEAAIGQAPINISGGIPKTGYTITEGTLTSTLTVIPRAVELHAFNKMYDGSHEATLSDSSVSNLVNDDDITLTSSAAEYATKNVGEDIKVTLSGLQISGSDAANYSITSSMVANGKILPREIELSAFKPYDGSTDLNGFVSIVTGVSNNGFAETLDYTNATAASAEIAGPDGETSTDDNYISSITLLDANDGSGGKANNYKLPILNAQNAPVSIISGSPSKVVKVAGDEQTALSGEAVTVAPSVSVMSDADEPIAGVEVRFEVESGGGNVNPASEITTNADGIASLDSWILGSGFGKNTLKAIIVGSDPLISSTFLATATTSLSEVILNQIPDREYTGLAITPSTSLQNGGVSLTEGTDYTVSYSNNTDVGTAGVTITGTGNYSGSLETTFEITPKDVS
ncbi:YDG domain-containing protein, partial [Gracilimonas halophila]